jgi:hypothetical protein
MNPIKWIQGVLRNVLLFAFYVSPIGWCYIIGILYLDGVDWLTLPFEVKAEKYMKNRKKVKETKMNDIAQPLFGLSRILGKKGGGSIAPE